MGAWNATSFGNDAACDWLGDLEGYEDLSFVQEALQAVLSAGDDYIECDTACEAIAAAEVVAALRGYPASSGADDINEWVGSNELEASDNLVRKALDALDRIQREPSELPELWEDDPDWQAAMADLRKRLKMG
ncbi:DUF4259 domain-containing protein [Haloferula sp. BvORR071]|uniref:DUF4259 domain-containing protein n=1 Tax=Haloferula sp. BvORR071 TaxID=1396141 RepID=UPI0005511D21|nr:DUF4259 domain-containing protein [Haloferula sp. BvORR071]